MKNIINRLGNLLLLLLTAFYSFGNTTVVSRNQSDPSTRILEISKEKWNWIVEQRIDSLDLLIHVDFVFHEPRVRMDKVAYLGMVDHGNIVFNQIDVRDVDIQVTEDLIILKTNVDFTAAMAGNQTERKSVIEVYKKNDKDWKLILLQVDPIQ